MYLANDKYSATLTSGYTVGQSTLYVSAVPDNVPTIIVAAKGTDNETVFAVTGKTENSLTGVSRLRGANVDLDATTPLTCLNNEEFVNQYQNAASTPEALKNLIYAADGGSTDAYAISLDPAPEEYVAGMLVAFKANTANTEASTLNVNSLGAKAIKKNYDEDLADGDIQAGQIVTAVYDGTSFQLVSPGANTPTMDDIPAVSTDGWTADTDTWVYVGAGQFKIVGKDVTARFPKGTRIKLTQTSVKYFVVTASVFSTDTTVSVTGGTDYTLANAAITSPYYSYQACPQGYPQYFNYVPSFDVAKMDNGSGGQPTVSTARFGVIGKTCYGYVNANGSKVGAGAYLIFNPPVAFSDEIDNYTCLGFGFNQYSEKIGNAVRQSSAFRLYFNDSIADDAPVYCECSWEYEI